MRRFCASRLCAVPGAVFWPAKACDAAGNRHILEFSRRKVGDIAKIHQFKARFADKSGGDGAEPKKIALFSYCGAVQNNLQSIKTPTGEPGLLDGMRCFSFF